MISKYVLHSKALNIGKGTYSGRKHLPADIVISLQGTEKGIVLTICGNIYNRTKSYIICGGQCIDDIASMFPDDKKVQRIKEVWERWHLNDLRAGTPAQEEYIRSNNLRGLDFTDLVAKLEDAGLYDDNGYKYGSAWLFEKIPDAIIKEIKSW